jgi:flavoprotein family protein
MSTAILGGGAAGCLLALRLKTLLPHEPVVIFERSGTPLAKVRSTGGGRCNVTNTFAHVDDIAAVYPRGARLMSRLLRATPPKTLMQWWESIGVPLRVEAEGRVFPASQQSDTVVNALLTHLQRVGVELRTGCDVQGVERQADGTLLLTDRHGDALSATPFAQVAVTCGGLSRPEAFAPWRAMGHEIAAPCPSLFGLRLEAPALAALSGVTVGEVTLALSGTKVRAEGPLLITRQGVSGPGVLRLSAYGARLLADAGHRGTLLIGWCGTSDTAAALSELHTLFAAHGGRAVGSVRAFDLPSRLWALLLERAEVPADRRCAELNRKQLNRLAAVLTADAYAITGRTTHQGEFVTCGGVSLSSVSPKTMESKHVPGLFFAGEVLDIDGVTGGYNLTAAWLTGLTAAEGIARRVAQTAAQP